jgi:hypothetical protein
MRRFVSYLHLLQPLDGETAEEIDVRIEVEAEDGEPQTTSDATDSEVEADIGEAARRLVIPDDPTTLSYLLSGIVQVPGLERQVLLETPTTEERLEALDDLLDREMWLLRRRLRLYTPDPAEIAARRN